MFEAHRLLHHSTLGSSVIKKKKDNPQDSTLGNQQGHRAVPADILTDCWWSILQESLGKAMVQMTEKMVK